jgi:branched-chain amino acid transport system permease protein
MSELKKSWLLHLGIVALLLVLQFVLPSYHHGSMARIMVLTCYAMGYNILFGYTGLLSLGHALFFAAGMYGLSLSMQHLELLAGPALIIGLLSGGVVSLTIGLLLLRTTGVAFMIVTLMFSQAGYLTVLYFGEFTRGDEGLVIQQELRSIFGIDLSDPTSRYFAALLLMTICIIVSLRVVQAGFGRVLVAIRENDERTRMLGYDIQRHKLAAIVLSGTMSAAAGASYCLLFGYAGATFASVQYSIFPLLWVLLGGAGTVLGPFVGTLFMFYLIDLSSGLTTAYMLIAGFSLVMLTLFAPQGLVGEIRRRGIRWLP